MSRKGISKAGEQTLSANPQILSAAAPRMPDRTSGNGGGGSSDRAQMSFSNEEIAERAYQIFERDGRSDGRDMDHWLQAERELRTEREQQAGNRMSPGGARPGAQSSRAEEAPRSARRHQEQQPSTSM